MARGENERTVMNFPAQANSAEMMRLAAIWATEAGIKVAALVHDALLILAPLAQLDSDIAATKAIMAKASRAVLHDRLELRVGVDVIRYPNRYSDPRGQVLWDTINSILRDLETKAKEEEPR